MQRSRLERRAVDTTQKIRCSFCGTPNGAQKFFKGPGVYICGECVTRAQVALREDVEGSGNEPEIGF